MFHVCTLMHAAWHNVHVIEIMYYNKVLGMECNMKKNEIAQSQMMVFSYQSIYRILLGVSWELKTIVVVA